jgi:hypothetical protein
MRRMAAIIIALLLMAEFAQAAIPAGAAKNLPVMKKAFLSIWPQAPMLHIPAGQVEQESSWNEHATLKTPRELGRGLCQMTITKSFNIYLSAVQYKALKGWDWKTSPYDPEKQLTFLAYQDRDNFNASKAINDEERWKMACVRYNAGEGRINSRRRYAIAKGIPTDRWTGGLELAHSSLENSLLYGATLWKTVNAYPALIFKKAEKYKGVF